MLSLKFQHHLYMTQSNGQKLWMKFSYRIITVIQHYHSSTLGVHMVFCEVIQVRKCHDEVAFEVICINPMKL